MHNPIICIIALIIALFALNIVSIAVEYFLTGHVIQSGILCIVAGLFAMLAKFVEEKS